MEELNTLYIYINNSDTQDDIDAIKLKKRYDEYAKKHNKQIESEYYDSGFDLFNTHELIIKNEENSYTSPIMLNTQIKCAMFDNNNKPRSFYLYARSSISKTHLRLANNVGIIDSGYRGDIIGVFDIINPNLYGGGDKYISMEKYTRLLQICSGDLKPFKVIILDTPECLGTTQRGIGGFGSTGK